MNPFLYLYLCIYIKCWLLRIAYDELIFKELNNIKISCFSHMVLVGMEKIWFWWKLQSLYSLVQKTILSFVFDLFLMLVFFWGDRAADPFICISKHSNWAIPWNPGGWAPALINLLFTFLSSGPMLHSAQRITV